MKLLVQKMKKLLMFENKITIITYKILITINT